MNASPDNYEQLEASLTRAQSELDAAETHGLFCGLLCASGRASEEQWLAEVFEEEVDVSNVAVEQCRRELKEVADDLRNSLYSGEMDLQLMLPDDDAPLGDRAEALGNWCHGFLFGLGLGGVKQEEIRSDEVRELLKDMGEIARIRLDGEEGNEEDESALMEIVEYLRVGVLYIVETLHPLQAPPRLQ